MQLYRLMVVGKLCIYHLRVLELIHAHGQNLAIFDHIQAVGQHIQVVEQHNRVVEHHTQVVELHNQVVEDHIHIQVEDHNLGVHEVDIDHIHLVVHMEVVVHEVDIDHIHLVVHMEVVVHILLVEMGITQQTYKFRNRSV